MSSTIKNAWAIPDLHEKIPFTLFIIVVFRFGAVIAVPFLSVEALQGSMDQVGGSGNALGYLGMLSGGAFANATLLATSVTPYINSSIILQLLVVALPPLECLAKEGREGRRKIAAITRYVTVVLSLIQGTAYHFYLHSSSYEGTPTTMFDSDWERAFSVVVVIFTFTAGTALVMWIGEQVNKYNTDSGVSILLFSGIVTHMPHIMNTLGKYLQITNQDPSTYGKYYVFVLIFVVLFLAITWFIILTNSSEHRTPIQYAKCTVGYRMYGGQANRIPIKIVMSGIMPIISTSPILVIPSTIQLFTNPESGFWKDFLDAFFSTGWMYSLVYFLLIVMFAYFYVTIQYNPIEVASNPRQSNDTIPGIRPGKPTSGFISRILSKLTLIGALFLAVITLSPITFGMTTGMHNISLDGISLITLVGVALNIVRQMESQVMMRHYKDFLD